MAATFLCSSAEFKGLKDPYTGLDLPVEMVITSDGKAFFHAPSAYVTGHSHGTPAYALREWSRKDGVYGLRVPDPLPRCAYTGKPLSIEPDGSLKGGFDPTLLYPRETFLHFVWMRDGESKFPEPKGETRVTAVTETAPAPLSHEVGITDESFEEAGKVVREAKLSVPKKTQVTSGFQSKGRKSR